MLLVRAGRQLFPIGSQKSRAHLHQLTSRKLGRNVMLCTTDHRLGLQKLDRKYQCPYKSDWCPSIIDIEEG